MRCKHNIKNRQGIASPSNWGKQIASVICLGCGEILSTRMIDSNQVEEQEPSSSINLSKGVKKE